MDRDPLERQASRQDLKELARRGVLTSEELEKSLSHLGCQPSKEKWKLFVFRMLLGWGTAFLISGIIFFFAYNWDVLHRFFKLGMVGTLLFIGAVISLYLGLEKWPGQVTLLASAILIGPLLGVYGQVYQTGADSYKLFGSWAFLALGWAVISRFAPLWILEIILFNLTIYLYWDQTSIHSWQVPGSFALLALINALALATWEILSLRWEWMKDSWFPPLAAAGSLFFLVISFVVWLFAGSQYSPLLYLNFLLIPLALPLFYYSYHSLRRDLFILTLVVLATICLVLYVLVRIFKGSPPEAMFFVLAFAVLAQGIGGAYWLRSLYIEEREGK